MDAGGDDSDDSTPELVPIISGREEILEAGTKGDRLKSPLQTSLEQHLLVSKLKRTIFYYFIIATTIDGLMYFFLPLATASNTFSFATLFRSKGIYSLTLAILSSGVIRSLNGQVDCLSVFLFATCFHCMASLSNLAFAVSSHGIRVMHAYEWLSMLFYISFLSVLGGSHRSHAVNKALIGSGLKLQ